MERITRTAMTILFSYHLTTPSPALFIFFLYIPNSPYRFSLYPLSPTFSFERSALFPHSPFQTSHFPITLCAMPYALSDSTFDVGRSMFDLPAMPGNRCEANLTI
jgi:hypothetical protein